MQIREIVRLAPRKRQTLLFSATMTEQVQQLITMSLKFPVRLAADAAGRAPEELRQEIVRLKVRTATTSCAAIGQSILLSCIIAGTESCLPQIDLGIANIGSKASHTNILPG